MHLNDETFEKIHAKHPEERLGVNDSFQDDKPDTADTSQAPGVDNKAHEAHKDR